MFHSMLASVVEWHCVRDMFSCPCSLWICFSIVKLYLDQNATRIQRFLEEDQAYTFRMRFCKMPRKIVSISNHINAKNNTHEEFRKTIPGYVLC